MLESASAGRDKILGAISLGTAALNAFNLALEHLARIAGPNNERLSFESVVPGIPEPTSLRAISDQFSGTIELLKSLEGVEHTQLIPDQDLSELSSRVGELKTSTDALSSSATEFTSTGIVTGVDASSLMATNSANQRLDVGARFAALYRPIQGLLSAVRKLLPDRTSSDNSTLLAAAAELAVVRSSQQAAAGDIAAAQRTLSKTEKAIQQILADAQRQMEAITKVSEQGPGVQEKLTAMLQEGTALLQKITAVDAQAKSLEQTVGSYKTAFDKFEVALEAREKMLEEGNEVYAQSISDNESLKQELNRITDRARKVLGEATVAGLSDRFASETQSLDRKLLLSLTAFFFGIAFFVFSAGIVLDVFPWLRPYVQIRLPYAPQSETIWPNAVYLFGTVISKLVLLLPSLLIIAFSAKWYAALFKLRKEYAYKYTVAASVPGFKVEAPILADAVAAIAFQQLLQNPSDEADDKIVDKGADVGNPWLQKILDPYIMKRMEQIFASKDAQR